MLRVKHVVFATHSNRRRLVMNDATVGFIVWFVFMLVFGVNEVIAFRRDAREIRRRR